MDLTKIIAISGMPGLYKVIGSMKQGAVVESLSDGKRFPTYATHKISALSDISVYTTGESMPLAEVFKKVYDKEAGKETPAIKPDSDEMKNYFESVLPEYDKEKVHNSDMKKLLNWYNVLLKKDLIRFDEEKKEEKSEEGKTEETPTQIPTVEKVSVKKTEIHQSTISPRAPSTPRKNINVRRKTG